MFVREEARKLLKLAWPILIAQLTQTAMGFVDTVMAGRVSAVDMAAVAVASSIWIPVILFLQGLILALPPIISRLNGAKNFDDIPFMTYQALWMALTLSFVIVLVGVFAPQIMATFEMEADLRDITASYLQYIAGGAPAFGLYLVLRNYCEGVSLTKPTMIISFIGLLVNIPANYIFVYGEFGMPALGGAGCGLATALVYWAMFLSVVYYCYNTKRLKHIHLFDKVHKPDVKAIVAIVETRCTYLFGANV